MKLELPDNNASVLFHMGNALQSIARDIDTSLPVNGHKIAHTETVGEVSHSVTVEPLVKLSESIDKMIESVAADWKVPVNRLTGNTTDAKQDGKSVLSDCLDDIDALISVSDTIDADGLPWDQRIHSSGSSERSRTSKNTWRMARKPKDKTDEEWAEYVEGVKAELKALMAIPVATVESPHDCNGEPCVDQGCDAMAQFVEAVTPRTITVNLPGVVHAVEINGTLEFPPVVDAVVTPPVVDAVVTPPTVIEAPEVVTPPVVIEAPEVIAPPVVDAEVVTPPIVIEAPEVVTPPVVDAVVTGPTTFPELMKFITVNNKKLTKESVDEALKAQGLASIALLAARTDLIPQTHAALVKLL